MQLVTTIDVLLLYASGRMSQVSLKEQMRPSRMTIMRLRVMMAIWVLTGKVSVEIGGVLG